MADFNVADRVLELCKARSWSLYRLAHEAICRIQASVPVYTRLPHPLLYLLRKFVVGSALHSRSFFQKKMNWQNLRWMNGSACHTGRRLAQRTKN